MDESIFARLFAGVPSDTFDAIPLIPFGQWLLPIGIFMIAVGFGAERNDKIGMLSGYRYGTVLNWWKKRFGKGLIWGLQKAGFLLLAVFACELVTRRALCLSFGEVIKISLLWMFHIISLDALFLLLDLVLAKRFVPTALLLLEGVTFLFGCQIKAVSNSMYGMWGMYLRSNWYGTGGFSAGRIIAAELLLLAAGYYTGRIYLKKEIYRI